jgi:hypothetical protein
VYGGTIPAKIFRAYMEEALEGQPVEQFPKPSEDAGLSATPTATATGTPTPTGSPLPGSSPTVQVSLPPVGPTKKGGKPSPTPSASPSPTSSPAPSPATS